MSWIQIESTRMRVGGAPVNRRREVPNSSVGAGTIYFDGSCGLCTASARRLGRLFGRRGFDLVPLQSEGAAELIGFDPQTVPDEMKLRTREGRIIGGAEALVYLSRHVWWMAPLWVLAQLPGGRSAISLIYRWVARNRHRVSGACGLAQREESPSPHNSTSRYISVHSDETVTKEMWAPRADLVVALVPVVAATLLGRSLPPWGYMWLIAWAVWMGCKWLTWRFEAARTRRAIPLNRELGYFLFWPGMDAHPFAHPARPAVAPVREWIAAIAVTSSGAVLTWAAVRVAILFSPLLAGWIGMIGTVLVLHFGTFRVLALIWRTQGVLVEPLMKQPYRAIWLSDFWARWNRGFRDFAYRLVFRPVHRRFGLIAATGATFLVSGLVHDLVISVPAGAGYGLPTLYFLIQGAGILLEKSAVARGMPRLAHRMCTYVVLLAPLPLLFHPAFIRTVFIPFLVAIRAV